MDINRTTSKRTTQLAHRTKVHYFASSMRFVGRMLLITMCWAIAPSASALEFQCEAFGDKRLLRVEIPGQDALCEVSVTYEQTGKRQVMWYARNDTLFCSARAYELRDKYQDVWDYTCKTSLDVDGIDQLSSAQRLIFDQRLKTHIREGKNAQPPFEVLAVRAVASNPLDKEAAKIAIQFFTDKGDFTEIVDDKVQSWEIMATIGELSEYITSDVPVIQALMHSISDEMALEVHTQLNDPNDDICYGIQILRLQSSSRAIDANSPHRFSCKDNEERVNSVKPVFPKSVDITAQ